MNRLRYALALLLLLAIPRQFCFAQTTQPVVDDSVASVSARDLVANLLNQITGILRDPQNTKLQSSQKVRQIAYDHIDFEILSRLTLAKNWRGLTPDQQSQFVQEFRKHLSATYAHVTDNYNNEDLIVINDRQEPNNDWTVQTRIQGTKTNDAKQDSTDVDYRLRQRDGHWKVIDVTVDGVSLVANFRAQFQEIMANDGFDHLLQLLRDKNAADNQ